MISVNPENGQVIGEYPPITMAAVKDILTEMDEDRQLRSMPYSERAGLMERLAQLLEQDAQELSVLMALEMGKPVGQGVQEIKKSALVCRYYAERAETFLAARPCETEASQSEVVFEPLGLILAVMPWNFPFWQVFRCLAPLMMAGNSIALKHASNVQACAGAIEELVHRAGFPSSSFRNLQVGSDMVERIIGLSEVKAVTLTGSTPAGRAVASSAGRALKKAVLELGGSDPYLILEDADLDLAVREAAFARLLNSGQSCIAAKRLIVARPIADEFVERLILEMNRYSVGSPLDEGTQIGPMARIDLRDELHSQLVRACREGAQVAGGGYLPDGAGAFYPPTVLTDVKKGNTAATEELFGPIAAVMVAGDEEEAVAIANESEFGLGASIYSQNLERARKLADRIDAGSCFVNAFVRSDPRLPFGGIKGSGYGRELSDFGILEFVNIKTIFVG